MSLAQSGTNLWKDRKSCRIMCSQCAGIPGGWVSGGGMGGGGVLQISHHIPAVISTLWREGICHLAACSPLRSQELWSIVKFLRVRSISGPTELLNSGNGSPGQWPFLEWLLPTLVQGLIKVMSFFIFSCRLIRCVCKVDRRSPTGRTPRRWNAFALDDL